MDHVNHPKIILLCPRQKRGMDSKDHFLNARVSGPITSSLPINFPEDESRELACNLSESDGDRESVYAEFSEVERQRLLITARAVSGATFACSYRRR